MANHNIEKRYNLTGLKLSIKKDDSLYELRFEGCDLFLNDELVKEARDVEEFMEYCGSAFSGLQHWIVSAIQDDGVSLA